MKRPSSRSELGIDSQDINQGQSPDRPRNGTGAVQSRDASAWFRLSGLTLPPIRASSQTIVTVKLESLTAEKPSFRAVCRPMNQR